MFTESISLEGLNYKIDNLKQENRHLLWMLMEWPIHRYLLANTKGRLNGVEKAERHLYMSAIFVASKKRCSIDKAKSYDEWMKVHDATQKLTGHLDTEIGFPIDETDDMDYNKLSRKFFDKFIALAEEAYNNA
jgi:hypothetical protein